MSVENVLQGILSQKVVADGGGYAVKNDLVNVDTITASSLNLSGQLLSGTTGAVKMGSTLDLNGNLLRNTGAGVNGFVGYVTLGSPLDMNANILINTNGGGVLMGTSLNMATQEIFNATRIRILPQSTQAGTITITNNTAASLSVADVTTSSIVIVTPQSNPATYYWVTTATGSITINTSASTNTTFNYYIAKY